jgi:hypothetical protein
VIFTELPIAFILVLLEAFEGAKADSASWTLVLGRLAVDFADLAKG